MNLTEGALYGQMFNHEWQDIPGSHCGEGKPCSDDSPKQADLIKQRASETCLTMLENKLLNSSEYNSTGDRYSHSGNDVCEVRCKEVGDFKSPYFTRFGLMPHGTPCDAKPCWKQLVWNTDESKNPVNFANTYWHYKFFEYLYTTGPISEPAIIKLYQKNALEKKGIHYAYSLPKTGEWKNNGTYNLKLRTCDCPTGFYAKIEREDICENDAMHVELTVAAAVIFTVSMVRHWTSPLARASVRNTRRDVIYIHHRSLDSFTA
uniref:Uncharacterized protein n=1 Tax=Magallana gigas TaxID=29159 RepID=K1R6D3_MAGGI